MIKLVVPAAFALGAGAFLYMRHRHKVEEERLDAELAASGYPGE